VSPVRNELGFYIPEDDILQAFHNLLNVLVQIVNGNKKSLFRMRNGCICVSMPLIQYIPGEVIKHRNSFLQKFLT
jgi:hypothetical protein